MGYPGYVYLTVAITLGLGVTLGLIETWWKRRRPLPSYPLEEEKSPREPGYRDNARGDAPVPEAAPSEAPPWAPPPPKEPERVVRFWSPCPACGSNKRTMSDYAGRDECPEGEHAHYTCSECGFRFVTLAPHVRGPWGFQ